MLKDSSWVIRGKITAFDKDVIYTSDQIDDDKTFNDMVRCDYAVLVKDEEIKPVIEDTQIIEPQAEIVITDIIDEPIKAEIATKTIKNRSKK